MANPHIPKKQVNFHDVEIEQLAQFWLTISLDSAIGAQQKHEDL